MRLSVLIPTYRRPRQLAACLAGLAPQAGGEVDAEVVVGFDGPDPEGIAAAEAAWLEAGGDPSRLRLEAVVPRTGYVDVRHRLVPTLEGDVYVSLNDDVRPAPGFLAAHRAAHAAPGGPRVVVGDSRFLPVASPSIVDRLVGETSLVFFWDRMDPSDPARDHGFRHAFGLNVSAPLETVRAVGGVPSMPHTYGYDDIELGWRLAVRGGLPVHHRPEARAPHDHRYRAADLLRRERSLGRAAVRYARLEPDFARAVFRRDILAEAETAHGLELLRRDRGALERGRAAFLALDRVPASTIAGPHEAGLLEALLLQSLPVRRACWHEGRLEELGRLPGDRPGLSDPEAIEDAARAAAAEVAAMGRDAAATETTT